MVLMTDAESSSYQETAKLWQALGAVQPRVFTFEISSGGNAYSQDLMQDRAAVNTGSMRDGQPSTPSNRALRGRPVSCAGRRPMA